MNLQCIGNNKIGNKGVKLLTKARFPNLKTCALCIILIIKFRQMPNIVRGNQTLDKV